MHALEPGAAGEIWAALGRRFPRPDAIVIASAHWETADPALTSSKRPETIHDFYGFPQPLYQIRYAAPGAPRVAERARDLLRAAGLDAETDAQRGLDHGAWSPLLHAYPKADVPVVELSVQPGLGTRHHLAVGRALKSLGQENVLVIGSGHLTHNLRDWQRSEPDAPPAAYALEFQEWVREKIERPDFESLADYRTSAPHGARAHPTEEHFLPLFVALGAAPDGARPERVFDAIEGGALAMDSYVFG